MLRPARPARRTRRSSPSFGSPPVSANWIPASSSTLPPAPSERSRYGEVATEAAALVWPVDGTIRVIDPVRRSGDADGERPSCSAWRGRGRRSPARRCAASAASAQRIRQARPRRASSSGRRARRSPGYAAGLVCSSLRRRRATVQEVSAVGHEVIRAHVPTASPSTAGATRNPLRLLALKRAPWSRPVSSPGHVSNSGRCLHGQTGAGVRERQANARTRGRRPGPDGRSC